MQGRALAIDEAGPPLDLGAHLLYPTGDGHHVALAIAREFPEEIVEPLFCRLRHVGHDRRPVVHIRAQRDRVAEAVAYPEELELDRLVDAPQPLHQGPEVLPGVERQPQGLELAAEL